MDMDEILDAVIVDEPPPAPQGNQLVTIVQQSGLEPSKSQFILERFQGFFALAAEWEAKARALQVTDESQTAEMKMAREGRLFLRSKRLEVERARKEMKEKALREGKAIDGIANVLKGLIEPIEEQLEASEKFAERLAEERKFQRKLERENALMPYVDDIRGYSVGEMTDEAFANLLAGAKEAHAARQEAAKKAEEERIAREKAEAEERVRIAQENARLKAEAEALARQMASERAEREKAEAEQRRIEAEKEAALASERARAFEALQMEREEKARLEAKLKAEADAKAKREAEEKAAAEAKAKEEEKARKKAEAAPDKAKLLAFADAINALRAPDVKSTAARVAIQDAVSALNDVVTELRQDAEAL